MKNLSLLIWVTQLGLSVVGPLVGYVLLALWLRNRFDLGAWVILLGAALGMFSAVDGLRSSLRLMSRMSQKEEKEEALPAISFNDHD